MKLISFGQSGDYSIFGKRSLILKKFYIKNKCNIKIMNWDDKNLKMTWHEFKLTLSLIINSSSLKIKIVRKNIFYEISHYFLKEIVL